MGVLTFDLAFFLLATFAAALVAGLAGFAFGLVAEEVQPVIEALRGGGIEITAIHSHMLDEQPRLIFMHYWANDDAQKLARVLRDALDKTVRAKS